MSFPYILGMRTNIFILFSLTDYHIQWKYFLSQSNMSKINRRGSLLNFVPPTSSSAKNFYIFSSRTPGTIDN